MTPVNIARCPIHGLHGQRDECFECGGPVEQVAMVPAHVVDEIERERVRAALKLLNLEVTVCEAVMFLDARREDGLEFPYDSRPLRKLRAAEAATRVEVCKCDHPMTKHLHVNLGGDAREYGTCTLCPCRLFRRKAS